MRNERDQWRDQALANKQEVEKLRGGIIMLASHVDNTVGKIGNGKMNRNLGAS